MTRILGIIPARGGSKGIPRKNLVDLCGKALRCKCVADQIVEAAETQLHHGRFAESCLYGDGQVSGRIADALERVVVYREKRLDRS